MGVCDGMWESAGAACVVRVWICGGIMLFVGCLYMRGESVCVCGRVESFLALGKSSKNQQAYAFNMNSIFVFVNNLYKITHRAIIILYSLVIHNTYYLY